MIELHYWPTSNGQKIAIYLEETGLAYEAKPVNIRKGEQSRPEFLTISPNGKIPAIVDRSPADGGGPLSVFESGAILMYLAEKTGEYFPTSLRGRAQTLQWLFWQVGGTGPMFGQKNHFKGASEKIPYAIDRYTKESERLIGVLDRRLGEAEYVAEDYSIADMAIYPGLISAIKNGDDLAPFKNVSRWMEEIAARPAVQRAYEKAKAITG